MPFVDDGDVQVHLPADTLKVEGIPDDRARVYEDAARIVRGYLAGVVDSATLALWVEPDTTPDIIRAITGRFAAAEIYRLRFGQGSMTDPQYAKVKYDEAMAMLMQIIQGHIDVPGVEEGTAFDNTWFEPTDASTNPPKFVMDGRF